MAAQEAMDSSRHEFGDDSTALRKTTINFQKVYNVAQKHHESLYGT